MCKLDCGASGGPASSSSAAARRVVSFLPREHGAYGQLALALLVAHLTGPSGRAAWFLTLAAFVSHEPLLVALGRRGERARIRAGSKAQRLLIALFGTGLLAAAAGLALGPNSARWSALACAALAVPLAAHVVRSDASASVSRAAGPA